jgi:putative ABC transport system substrate-binding protein
MSLGQRPAKTWRIGYLTVGAPKDEAADLEEFRKGLRALGYVEGQNLDLELRYASSVDALPNLVEELLRAKVDLILASSTPAARAAQRGTRSIPIVFAGVSDPLGSGLVRSLRQPGGNVTGTMDQGVDVSGKRLDLLKQVVPRLKRVAELGYPNDPLWRPASQEVKRAARQLGIDLVPVSVEVPEEIDLAVARVASQVEGLFVTPQVFFWVNRQRLIAAAAQAKLPAVYEFEDYVVDGGLMSYGPVFPVLYRNAARQVDTILKGAKPASVPVEQPTEFKLAVNLRTAKAIGLTLSREFLLRVDKAIE